MNELLGWYGYEKVVDRRDTQGLNLGHFAATSSEEEGRSGPDEDSAGEQQRHHRQRKQKQHRRSARLTPSERSSRGSAATPAAIDDALVCAAPQVGEPGTSPRDE
ncbi:hypothetical protein V5799_033182, partial [Amblyomma americanum]